MSFADKPQWVRHTVIDLKDLVSIEPTIMCYRCRKFFAGPLTSLIICTKDDRIFLGDVPNAENCHAL